MSKHYENRALGVAFDYPETWTAEDADALQVFNTASPHGAITISLLLEGELGGPAEVRLRYADRTTSDPGSTPVVERWPFIGAERGGLVTYIHEPTAVDEAAVAAAVIESIVIAGKTPR
jgi:hypothetical protein